MGRSVNLSDLRGRAEEAIAAARRLRGTPDGDFDPQVPDAQRLVEELRVYQAELEIQNQELINTQDQLALSGRKYRALFDHQPLPSLLCNEHAFVVEANDQARTLLGMHASEIRQQYSLLNHIDAESRTRLRFTSLQQGPAEKRVVRHVMVHAANGESLACDLHLVRIDENETHEPLVLVTFVDKTLEVELARQAAELVEAKQAAESASRAKSAFLAKISHEIRTPMNAVIGFAWLLERSDLDSGQREKLSRLKGAAAHLLQIINDVLDLSKIESEKLFLESAPFSLEETLEDALSLVREKALEKGVELTCQVDCDVPVRLIGDSLRVRQALLNYLSNAVKFTEQGQIDLHVSSRRDEAGGVLLHFSVRDTGCGLSQEVLGRLFSPFEQADNSLARRFGGTGLGLVITRQLARLMGGDAGAESRPGEGSTFWFTARFNHATLPAGDALLPLADADLLAGRLSERYAGRRILVCEDEALNQYVLQEMLATLGFSVVLAGDGAEAVTQAATGAFDLILMDMQMPVMDGVTATRRLRTLTATQKTPIIALTANAYASDRKACLDAGMNDFVSKPIDPAQLYASLLRCFTSA